MTLQLPLAYGKKQMTLISAYAPTMTNPDEIKHKFYEELHAIIGSVPKGHKLVVLGDFNARVGSDSSTWDGVLGKHGVGKCNSNGLLLLQTCMEFDLLVTNTLFCLPTRNRTSWMHPRSKHWHLIDYVLMRKKDRQDVRVTKSMCGADCWTDHRLIISKLNIRIQPKCRTQEAKAPKRLDITRLQLPDVKQSFVETLKKRLDSLPPDHQDIEASWAALRNLLHETASEVLGTPTRKHKDWFDENCEEIRNLLDEKHRLHKVYLNNPNSLSHKDRYNCIRRKVQQTLHQMQDRWLSNKADVIQSFADRKDMKNFYSALQEVYGPTSSGSFPLLSADGSSLITERDKILARWAEHFNDVLNRPSTINDEAIARLPQVPINNSMDDPPTLAETQKAISMLSSGKAAGPDSIPAEIYKHGGITLETKLHNLFLLMWQQEKIPQEYKDASIIHLYKRKGNRQDCNNHRGISLLSIAGKILARLLLNRLTKHLNQGLLPESQCGFRKNRGTVDMIFAARQLQEKCQEQNVSLYSTYVDLTKAFDTVSRDGLWKIMVKFGCPSTFILMVRQFHDGMQARVQDNGTFTEPFAVSNGVKQGCVLAPTLFSIMFSAMLTDAFREGDIGLTVKYRTDGQLFNLRRLQAKTKVHSVNIRDFLFADDCALNAGTEEDMQLSVDKFSTACNNFGLTISTKKTEVLHQPAPGAPYVAPCIKVNGQALVNVDKFTYLGSTLSQSANIDNEVSARLAKASAAFGRLTDKVWNRCGITIQTKLKVYKAVIIPTLLYGSESWTVYSRHANKLNHFHTVKLRKLMNIKWYDHIPDSEVLTKANLPSIHSLLHKSQLRWAGHVVRMSDNRLPKQLLYGELLTGKRSRGGQKKRFKDAIKSSLKAFNIDHNSWEQNALNRPMWRSLIITGSKAFEEDRKTAAEQKRQARKLRGPNDAGNIPCPNCKMTFSAQIGLTSHLRTHKLDP